MSRLIDSFWRAAVYCLHPRVIALSFLPLIIMTVASLGLGYLYWNDAVDMLRTQLDSYQLVSSMSQWLEGLGLGNLRLVLAPALLLFLAIPVIVITSLLFVAMMMTPAMVSLVGERRFATLERRQGGSLAASMLWSLASTLLACIALVLSFPLWLVPPLVLVLPPLIWGWLTYRVMAYDALAEHASADERRQIFKEHRWSLLSIGVLSGYLGAVPSVIWASGAMFVAMAPILVPVALWIYTLVFAFSSLWFAHFALSALQQLRSRDEFMSTAGSAVEVPVLPAAPATEPLPPLP
ncbi:MAG: EI24 domain-containing protein [Comamonadaceae bacterium]|nr:EI24 domain-containing protein [Comamonadaceae bacterium]